MLGKIRTYRLLLFWASVEFLSFQAIAQQPVVTEPLQAYAKVVPSAVVESRDQSYHTLASELGKLASMARPGKLLLYHGLYYSLPEPVILDEVRENYDGDAVLADDLDVF